MKNPDHSFVDLVFFHKVLAQVLAPKCPTTPNPSLGSSPQHQHCMLTLSRAKHDGIHRCHHENRPNKHGVAGDAPVGALQVSVVFCVFVRSSSYHSQLLPVLMANSRRRISVRVSDEFTTRQPAAKPLVVHSGSRLANCHPSVEVSVWVDSCNAQAIGQCRLLAMNGPPAARNRCLLYPQERTFPWPSLTSGFDPKQTFMVLDAKSMSSNKFRARWGVFPSPAGVVIDRLSLYHRR